jgi:hypothetical protein
VLWHPLATTGVVGCDGGAPDDVEVADDLWLAAAALWWCLRFGDGVGDGVGEAEGEAVRFGACVADADGTALPQAQASSAGNATAAPVRNPAANLARTLIPRWSPPRPVVDDMQRPLPKTAAKPDATPGRGLPGKRYAPPPSGLPETATSRTALFIPQGPRRIMAHRDGAMMANSAIYRYTAYAAGGAFVPPFPLAIALRPGPITRPRRCIWLRSAIS